MAYLTFEDVSVTMSKQIDQRDGAGNNTDTTCSDGCNINDISYISNELFLS